MYILGFTGYQNSDSHDAAAALLRDGEILAAAEEERFSRRKHSPGEYPVRAASFCLNAAGLQIADLEAIAYGWNTNNEIVTVYPRSARSELSDKIFPRSLFPGEELPPVYSVRHHISHIAGAFYSSGFNAAACICVDGQGESEAITLAYADMGKINVLKRFDKIFSLGALFEAASVYTGLGFGVPGKLMGLAPYGKARHRIPLRFSWDRGEFELELPDVYENRTNFIQLVNAYLQYFENCIYPFKRGRTEESMSYIDFAASVQACVQDVIINLGRYLKQNTGMCNLVVCGGVALNCTANGVLERSGVFDRVYVPPGANDASCSFGAALEVYRMHGYFDRKVPAQLLDARLGPQYSNDEIKRCLVRRGLSPNFKEDNKLAETVAKAIHSDGIVLWFQGRSEFGPRALGARSILGNPCRRENHYRINRLKQREMWRPLSPSILEEEYSAFFQRSPSSPSHFMLKADLGIESSIRKAPAVFHIDDSARPQLVRKSINPLYHLLISEFRKLSGVPILLNTSLNSKGEPIVNSPSEAIDLFLRSPDVELLVIGNYVTRRRGFGANLCNLTAGLRCAARRAATILRFNLP